jgi:glyoxylase-like metal-dependent hydrolase (beta-lactamase superfamily II)
MKLADRIEVPTPFEVGRVNCYVLSENGLTVIDPGPATDEAYQKLERELEEHGHEIEEIERVLITHPHIDHFGLASRIAETSGARVLAHADTVDHLGDPEAFFDCEQDFFRPFLLSMGLPEQLVDTVVGLPEAYSDLQEPVEIDRELTDDDAIDAGVDLRVVHTPGHAPGSVCFVAADERVAFTGDHVLPGITPNPLLTLSPGS